MTEQSEGERLYILGHPVAHSKSPVMYNALYERLGLPWPYALADYAELDEARAFLDARDFLSVNITTPYKPLAFQAATRKAASAQLAQGANVLVRKDEQLIGFNTDGDGCVKFLELAGVTFKGKRVVVEEAKNAECLYEHFLGVSRRLAALLGVQLNYELLVALFEMMRVEEL